MTHLNTDEIRSIFFQLHVPKLNTSDKINSYQHTIGHVSLEYTDANTINYELDIQRNRIETSEVLKRAVVETDYERARQVINAQLAKISTSISAANPLCQQLMWDLEFQYPSQIESSISLATVHMQHEQKHNSHATTTTISEACKMSSNRGRSRSNYLF
ncbi:unnamed protein product [Rotaria socialis]|uniref:Uncharacterized protein n=1 Tax=Rotaria socialis TaxID=392032 RepID=A0A820WFT0_9BILA|nr:unnamed protein product [Rotaria socialis]CAF4515203.1 unnamed protein product [Rotaria socialis]